MNIDLGWLGKVVLVEIENPVWVGDSKNKFTVVMDGYTESGIRVHGIKVGRPEDAHLYPLVWQNAILIKV